jgi:hypothetical protein
MQARPGLRQDFRAPPLRGRRFPGEPRPKRSEEAYRPVRGRQRRFQVARRVDVRGRRQSEHNEPARVHDRTDGPDRGETRSPARTAGTVDWLGERAGRPSGDRGHQRGVIRKVEVRQQPTTPAPKVGPFTVSNMRLGLRHARSETGPPAGQPSPLEPGSQRRRNRLTQRIREWLSYRSRLRRR